MKFLIILFFSTTFFSPFFYSQDFSKKITNFNSENDSNKKEYIFNYSLPSDGYFFEISIDPKVVPIAIYFKYGDNEYWSGFVGQGVNNEYKQKDLSIKEKVKFLKIQSPLIRSSIESKIQSTSPDTLAISGSNQGVKCIVRYDSGTKLAVFEKIGENTYKFKSKSNVPLIEHNDLENKLLFRDTYIKYIYERLNIDPSEQSFLITKGKARDRIDKGICVLVKQPANFYMGYFSEMDELSRNFIGELIWQKENNGFLEKINSDIRSIGGKEITSIFPNGDDLAGKTTEKIARGDFFLKDGIKAYGEILDSEKRFTFPKKEGIDEITILVFSPLEKSSFNIQLNQSPEGLNQVYFKSGQLKEKYTLKSGKLNGENITYYEDKNFKVGQDSKPIKEIITYVNGSKTGVHNEYDFNQNVLSEEVLKDGVRNGIYKKYNGDFVSESGQYIDGLKNGEWISVLSYQKIIENFSNGKRNGPYKKYNGAIITEEGQYVGGLMNGEWIFRYENGNLKGKGKYINGDGGNVGYLTNLPNNGRNGEWFFYWEDGTEDIQGSFINGKRNGEFTFSFSDGIKRIENYNLDTLKEIFMKYPSLNTTLLKMPSCLIKINLNESSKYQYQAIDFMTKGDTYLKNGDHEKAIYSYKYGLQKFKIQELLDRIIPLGDYCYEQKHSGHVQDAFEYYLLTKTDAIRQKKFDECKEISNEALRDFYNTASEIVNDMNEDVKGRNSISKSNDNNKELQKEASKNCDTYIYICNDCSKMFSSKSEPNDRTTCTEPRWKGINSSFHEGKHQWQKIGRCGSDSFYCKGCGNRISVSETPARGTCGAKGNNCCTHNWLRD